MHPKTFDGMVRFEALAISESDSNLFRQKAEVFAGMHFTNSDIEGYTMSCDMDFGKGVGPWIVIVGWEGSDAETASRLARDLDN